LSTIVDNGVSVFDMDTDQDTTQHDTIRTRYPRVMYRVTDPGLLDWLTSRTGRMLTGNRNEQARTELGLWREVLAAELRRIRLTLAEACCVADVLNSTTLTPTVAGSIGHTYAEVYDAFNDAEGPSSYGNKWGVDEQQLLGKLRALGPAADHALVDAISRWWETTDQHKAVDAGTFAAVGLRVLPDPSAAESA
jgi:hypothetical protein